MEIEDVPPGPELGPEHLTTLVVGDGHGGTYKLTVRRCTYPSGGIIDHITLTADTFVSCSINVVKVP